MSKLSTLQYLAAVCIFSSTTMVHSGVTQYNQDFETQSPPRDWFVAGVAGFDWNKGMANRGKGNAWIRAKEGWNAVNVLIPLSSARPGAECTAQASLRTSSDLTGGYMSVRPAIAGSPPGPVINEVALSGATPPDNNGYKQYHFNFRKPSEDILFYVGLWGNGRDAWIQVDDVAVSCQTPN